MHKSREAVEKLGAAGAIRTGDRPLGQQIEDDINEK